MRNINFVWLKGAIPLKELVNLQRVGQMYAENRANKSRHKFSISHKTDDVYAPLLWTDNQALANIQNQNGGLIQIVTRPPATFDITKMVPESLRDKVQWIKINLPGSPPTYVPTISYEDVKDIEKGKSLIQKYPNIEKQIELHKTGSPVSDTIVQISSDLVRLLALHFAPGLYTDIGDTFLRTLPKEQDYKEDFFATRLISGNINASGKSSRPKLENDIIHCCNIKSIDSILGEIEQNFKIIVNNPLRFATIEDKRIAILYSEHPKIISALEAIKYLETKLYLDEKLNEFKQQLSTTPLNGSEEKFNRSSDNKFIDWRESRLNLTGEAFIGYISPVAGINDKNLPQLQQNWDKLKELFNIGEDRDADSFSWISPDKALNERYAYLRSFKKDSPLYKYAQTELTMLLSRTDTTNTEHELRKQLACLREELSTIKAKETANNGTLYQSTRCSYLEQVLAKATIVADQAKKVREKEETNTRELIITNKKQITPTPPAKRFKHIAGAFNKLFNKRQKSPLLQKMKEELDQLCKDKPILSSDNSLQARVNNDNKLFPWKTRLTEMFSGKEKGLAYTEILVKNYDTYKDKINVAYIAQIAKTSFKHGKLILANPKILDEMIQTRHLGYLTDGNPELAKYVLKNFSEQLKATEESQKLAAFIKSQCTSENQSIFRKIRNKLY